MKNLSLEEIQKKTLELLDSNDMETVSYITEDLISKDSLIEEDGINDDKSSNLTVDAIEGHNMRYTGWTDSNGNSVQGYAYERGPNETGNGCMNTYSKRLSQSYWNHTKIGNCTGSDALIRFTRR